MKISKAEALNIRDDDVVLVAMRVHRTNDHFDTNIGVKVVCYSPARDHRPMAEREKGPQLLDIMSGEAIHSVVVRKIRFGDWVEMDGGVQGKVLFLDGDEATVRRRRPSPTMNRNFVAKLGALRRILTPEDLTPEDVRAMK